MTQISIQNHGETTKINWSLVYGYQSLRQKYWIVGVTRMLKSIKYKCVACRKLDLKTQSQVMGLISYDRLKPAPAWSYTSLDIFGPFDIKGETNKRSRGKGYGIIFNCMLTRAIHLDLAVDYSTDGFLLVLRRFMALRGCPLKLRSDHGSKLVAADKELTQILAGHDLETLKSFGAANLFEWEFSSPDVPWQNGCAEALIKSVKKIIEDLCTSASFNIFWDADCIIRSSKLIKRKTNWTKSNRFKWWSIPLSKWSVAWPCLIKNSKWSIYKHKKSLSPTSLRAAINWCLLEKMDERFHSIINRATEMAYSMEERYGWWYCPRPRFQPNQRKLEAWTCLKGRC